MNMCTLCRCLQPTEIRESHVPRDMVSQTRVLPIFPSPLQQLHPFLCVPALLHHMADGVSGPRGTWLEGESLVRQFSCFYTIVGLLEAKGVTGGGREGRGIGGGEEREEEGVEGEGVSANRWQVCMYTNVCSHN